MFKTNFLFFIIIIFFCSCSKTNNDKYYNQEQHYSGHYKIGKPYIVENIKYHPKKDDNYKEIGVASWYGGEDGFNGKKTANGDLYNKTELTAAHRTLPLPSIVKVTNLTNNKSVIVMVNDRGPFSKKKLIDVSEKAAEILKMKHQGSTKVKVEFLKEETKKLLKHLSLAETEGSYADKNFGKSPKTFVEAQNRKFLFNKSSEEVLLNNKAFAYLKENKNKKYFVQIGSYKVKKNAEKITRDLDRFGKHNIKFSDSIYQVSFGPFRAQEGKSLIEHLINIGNDNIKIILN